MKLQICVFVFYIFLSRIHIDAVGVPTKCSIDGIDDQSWNLWFVVPNSVDDNTPAGTVIFEADATGISSISTITEPNRYFEASIKDGKFTVTVTEKLAQNYDEQETKKEFNEKFRVLCGDESNDLMFRFIINDINTHPPVFQNEPYEITIRLPLRTGDVITNSIVARDIDFTNTGIDFELFSNDFLKIETGLSTDRGKNHPAILTASRTVTSFTKQTIEITATDKGLQPHTLSTTTKITLIPDAIPDVPSFEKPLYIGNYNADGTVDLNSLKLSNAYVDDDVVDYTVEQDVTGVFQVTKNSDNSISVSTSRKIEEEFLDSFYIAFTIKAEHTIDKDIKPGYAVVIINLPQRDLSECTEDLICPDLCPRICDDCPVDCPVSCPPKCEDDCPVKCSESCPFECSEDCPTDCAAECPPKCEEDCPTICSTECPVKCDEDCPFECSKDCPTNCEAECPCNPNNCPDPEYPVDCPVLCPPKCEDDCPVKCSESCPFECSKDCPTNCEAECPCNPNNCPDPECPIDCSECPTNPPIGKSPQFRKDTYVAPIGVDHVGPIIQVEAEVEDGAELRYDAIINEAELKSKIEINPTTGVIMNTAAISPGKYDFAVTATVVATGKIGKATVILMIDSIPEACTDPDKQYASYALIIKHLDEKTPYDDILPILEHSTRPNCKYSIYSQVPDKGFFQISNDGKLICNANIDRDDEEFYSNYGSQVQVTLDVQCDSQANMNDMHTLGRNDSIIAAGLNNNLDRNTLDGRDMIFATNIRMNLTRTVLNIIIDDLNDNDPVFDSDIPSCIGYPTSNLASKIMPPQVIVLKATDRDIGENAEISYKLRNTDVFYVHEKTGAVYPKDVVLDGLEESKLVIKAVATDRNGNADGNSSPEKSIQVKLLSEDHISILTIKRALPDDIADILAQLRTATSSNIYILHSAVIPSPVATTGTYNIIERELTQSKLADVDLMLRLYIYALDTNNNPIKSKELIKTIESATLPWSTEIIELDKDDCDSECPENPECPECPTPTPGPGSVPVFEKPLYSFTLGPREMKSWDIKAKTDPEEELEYWLNIDDLVLESCLSIDSTTGTVTVTSYIPPSNYQFTVHARAPSSENEAYTTVSLVVTALTLECPVNEIKAVANSLNIIQLDEEQEHLNILPLDPENDKGCRFTLESQIPNKGFEMSATNGLTCGKVDRDDKDFYEQYNSQVQLELELHCPDSDSRTILPSYAYENTSFIGPRYHVKKLNARENGKYLVMTGNIKSSLTRTTVSVIFKDLNDNAPVFDADTPTIIGYPLSELASQIMPPSLITLKATDRDIGENAEIKYTLESESIFQIHPVTGVVYPKIQSLDSIDQEDLFFTATATDRNGAGLSSESIKITVKLLSSEHITVLTIKNALLEDADQIISQLSETLQRKLYALNAAVLPINSENNKQRQILRSLGFLQQRADSDESLLKLIVYGFDEKDELVQNEELIEAIEKSENSWDLSANEIKGQSKSEQDVTGYIVAVSILSVLIALMIGGVFLVWWFIIRPKQNGFRQSHSELIEEDSPPSLHKNIWTTESEVPKATPVASQFEEFPQARSLNDLLDGNKNDSFETLNRSVSFVKLEDKEDKEDQKPSDGPARKKSVVTFNENVEKITIEKEDNENEADAKTDVSS